MTSYLRIFIALSGLYFISCANVKPPAGGEKDITPPKLIENDCTPNPLTRTNYSLKYIELAFDEYIKDNNLMSELNITPSLKGSYVYDAYKRKIKIEFGEPLDSNTTYTFNFGNGIVDVTENNPAENLIFSFSTGSTMDSLEISGQVIENLTNNPLEKILVCLYSTSDTLNPSNAKPNYSVKTDVNGRYIFRNLREGTYKIYAIEDNNGDYKYQPNIDRIALLDSTITLTANLNKVNLRLFSEDKLQPRLNNIRNKNQFVNLEFNKTIFDIDLSATSKFDYYFLKPSKTIRLINSQETKDSLIIAIQAVDSLDRKIDTTVTVNFSFPKKPVKTAANLTIATNPKGFSNQLFEAEFNFNKPISTFNPDSLLIGITDTVSILQDANISYTWNKHKTQLVLQRTDNELPINLIAKKGTFITCEKDTLKANGIKSKLLTDNNYALLEGKIITQKPNYIVELIDENLTVIQTMKNVQLFTIPHLTAGTYFFRVLIDTNGNGEYDNGDYETNTLPEPIYFYPEAIKLKPNWEISDIKLEF